MQKSAKESRVYKTCHIFPTDLNHRGTLFGGKILAEMDMLASLSAVRHSRLECVTASMDWVDFLYPVHDQNCINYEAFVVWTGNTSMEVFVKAIAEDLKTGEQRVAATSFITFVALDENNRPSRVPQVVPETEEERVLHAIALERAKGRQSHKEHSRKIAELLSNT